MVGSLGMAGSLISFEAIESGPLTSGIVAKVLSNEAGREAVERILQESKSSVRMLLDEHRNLVEALRDALLARNELIDQEIGEVLVGTVLGPPEPDRNGHGDRNGRGDHTGEIVLS
jgi:cell division protease FtsH